MKSIKASADQQRKGRDGDGLGKKPLPPVPPVTAQDAGNVVFINGRSPCHNRSGRCSEFNRGDDFNLIRQGNLGVRDKGGRDKGMSPSADGASDPADAETQDSVFILKPSGIIAMYFQAAGMPASAGKLVKLDARDEVIIKILGYGIVKISG